MSSPQRRLRVGLDGRNAFLSQGTGIATYASLLAGEGTEWLIDAPVGQQVAGGRPLRYFRALAARARALPTRVEGGMRVANDAFRVAQVHFDMFGRLLVLGGQSLPDIMHWTSPLPLRLAGVPNLYTILDTIPLDHATSTNARRFHRILAAIADSADHVVTLSNAARADILRWLPGLSGRISVVPPAVTMVALPEAALHPILATWCLQARDYYVFVGTIEPRKNVAGLIRAFLATASSRRLVLAGPLGWRGQQELAEFAPAIADGRIRSLGYLPRPTLIGLLQGARALLFPSRAEGFGLPIIEAMALGTPVLTSRAGATEEVAGGAARLVDPSDGPGLQAAIAELDADDALCARLRALGFTQAARFTKARQSTLMGALYQDLLPATSISSVSAPVI
jgi:glycosyltransferase involved in cell wall biosynthesis